MATRSTQKLCPACREFRKPAPPEPEKQEVKIRPGIKTVDRYCRRCIYLAPVSITSTYHKACDYIGHTGRRRPCPAGTGCTVRKLRPDDNDQRGRVYRG